MQLCAGNKERHWEVGSGLSIEGTSSAALTRSSVKACAPGQQVVKRCRLAEGCGHRDTSAAKLIDLMTQCMVRPCVARVFVKIAVSGLASMYSASDWSVSCSGPPWISARVRSH